MKITNPEMKVVRFAADDVIATSVYIVGNKYFYGTMAPSGEPGTWIVGSNDTDGYYISDAEIDDLKQGSGDLNPFDTYDAYQTESYGPYYTKGASYYELYYNQQ